MIIQEIPSSNEELLDTKVLIDKKRCVNIHIVAVTKKTSNHLWNHPNWQRLDFCTWIAFFYAVFFTFCHPSPSKDWTQAVALHEQNPSSSENSHVNQLTWLTTAYASNAAGLLTFYKIHPVFSHCNFHPRKMHPSPPPLSIHFQQNREKNGCTI